MRTAVAAVRERDAGVPVLAVHNDVITSDFTTLFANVAGAESHLELGGGPVYSTAAAGSFYAQVVPAGTVHLGLCSNASHWYREQPAVSVPGGMYFSAAERGEREKLADQAGADWSEFLAARAAELAPGGRLFVEGIGRIEDPVGAERVSASRLLRVMWDVAVGLSDEGRLDRGVLDRYVFPVYCRSVAEATAPARDGGALAGALAVASAGVDEVPTPTGSSSARRRPRRVRGRLHRVRARLLRVGARRPPVRARRPGYRAGGAVRRIFRPLSRRDRGRPRRRPLRGVDLARRPR